MPGPIDTGVRADGRTDLDTWPVESTDPGIDHSHLDIVRPNDGTDRRLFLVARLGAAPRPFAQLIVPLTPGGVELADARGFAGIAVTVRGDGRYRLTLESYGIDPENSFAVAFAAVSAAREIRLPFAAFASSDPTARLDLASLRTLAFRLAGPPGGHAWLELANLRFYR